MDVLQLGYEIEVLQQNDLNEDEKLDRMIRCLDAVVMTGIQKSINKFVTEYVHGDVKSHHEALLILGKVESILKQHEDHFVAIFEEFFIDLHLFDYVVDSILHSISVMVKHLVQMDQDPSLVLALVQSYCTVCNIIKANCTEKEKLDVEWIESDTLHSFIGSEIKRLSNDYTLSLIENVIENTMWDVDIKDASVHFDEQNNFFFTHATGTEGALISCNGVESCLGATITGTNIAVIDCDALRACQYAKIRITDPTEHFVIECGGVNSCEGMEIEVNFSGAPPGYRCTYINNPTYVKPVFELEGIECAAPSACNSIDITINNESGCRAVNVELVECIQYNSCNGAVFDLLGDVTLGRCLCGASCGTAVGLESCYTPGVSRIYY
eukprot:453182_1